MRVLWTIKGARASVVPGMKVTFVFRLVASLGKHAFRKRNGYPFIDCSMKMVWQWYTGEVENSDICFRKSSHLSKQVSNLYTLSGWAGKTLEGVYCLKPREITNSDVKRWALLELVDKVGIVSVIQLNTI